MATITKGILGGFSGKVGTVVGANWRGKDIIRSKPKPSSRAPTEKQLLQQMKFKLAVTFLQPVRFIQSQYFGSGQGVKSRVNQAVSYTISDAMTVVAGIPELVFNKVLITKGDLAPFQNSAVTPQAGRVLQLTWDDNSAQGNAAATDLCNMICYAPALGTFEIFTEVATRDLLTASVTLPDYYAGQDVHLWAYFNNAAETLACNSPYLGLHTLI